MRRWLPMRHLATTVRLAGWVVVGAVGILAVARAVAWDVSLPILLGVHGLGPLPYLVLLPVAVVALARRHLRLAAVATAVAAAALPTGVPELTARRRVPPVAQTAPRLRILSWNLFDSNYDAAGIDRIVRNANPDVVVLQEYSRGNRGAVRRSPALAGYPHTFASPQPSAFGSAIWSRLPLEGAEEIRLEGLPMTRATVLTEAGPVRLVNVHVLSPLAEASRWKRQLSLLSEEAARPGPPILLAGDFNATWGHRPFRRLLATGLSDAAAARGALWAPTWPADGRLLRPLLRIDHVLTGPGLVATGYRTGPAGGSDHRSIVVDVAITQDRP